MLYARYVLKNHFYGVLEPIIFLLKFIYTPTQTPHGIYGLHKMRMCCTIVMVAHFIPFLISTFYHLNFRSQTKKIYAIMAGGRGLCHFGSSPTVVGVGRCSPLREGGYFLTASGDGFILAPQSLDTLPTTGLAHLHNHKIITPLIAGIGLFDLDTTSTTQRLAIELENLF